MNATTGYPAPTTGAIARDDKGAPLCRCGCGEPTSSYRAVYLPGHDSRHVSNLVRDVLESVDAQGASTKSIQKAVDEAFSALSSERLQDRLFNALRNWGRGRLLERLQAFNIRPFADNK